MVKIISERKPHLKKWVKKLVTLAKKRNFSTELFQAPCQISMIYLKNEKFILLIFTHDQKKMDLQISVLVAQSAQEARVLVDKNILTDEYYFKQGSIIKVAGFLGKTLTSRRRSYSLKLSIVAMGFLDSPKSNDGYLEIANVDPYNDEPEHLPSFKHTIPQKTSEVPSLEINAEYSSFLWYPPIAFTDSLITLKKALVLRTKYKDQSVIFDNKGFLCILIQMYPPYLAFVDKAVEIMNEITAVANVMGLDGSGVTKEDSVIFRHHGDSEEPIGVSHMRKATVRSLLFEDFLFNPARIYESNENIAFRFIKKSLMMKIIRKAEKITKNEEVKNYLSLFLDAKTHLLNGFNKAAFLHGWIVIEKYIDDMWSRCIKEQGITGSRHKKLSESILWTTDSKLETLNLMNIVSNERYFEMIRLKNIRNRVVHKEREVHTKETHECLRLCKEIMIELIRSRCFIEI